MDKLTHTHTQHHTVTLVLLPLTFTSRLLLLLNTFNLLLEDFGQELLKLVLLAQRSLEDGNKSLLSLLQLGYVSPLQFQQLITLLQLTLSGKRGGHVMDKYIRIY